jgi:hypothetical protein
MNAVSKLAVGAVALVALASVATPSHVMPR